MYSNTVGHSNNCQVNLTEVSAFSPGMTPAYYPSLSKEAKELFEAFWIRTHEKINSDDQDQTKVSKLPLARIKKIVKMDEDVQMIGSEVPVLFSKAAEIFIQELSIRAWIHTEENRRRTIQRNDISMAVARNEQFDFLIDVVPREDSHSAESNECSSPGIKDGSNSNFNQPSYTESKCISTNVTQLVPTNAQVANMIAASNSMIKVGVTTAKDPQAGGQQTFDSFASPTNLIGVPSNSFNFNHPHQQILGQNIRYLSPGYSNNGQPVSIAQFAVAPGTASHLGRAMMNNGQQRNIMHIGVPIANNITAGNQMRPTAYFSMNGCLPNNNQHLIPTTSLPYHIVPAYISQPSNMPLQLPSTVGQSQENQTKIEENESAPSRPHNS